MICYFFSAKEDLAKAIRDTRAGRLQRRTGARIVVLWLRLGIFLGQWRYQNCFTVLRACCSYVTAYSLYVSLLFCKHMLRFGTHRRRLVRTSAVKQ